MSIFVRWTFFVNRTHEVHSWKTKIANRIFSHLVTSVFELWRYAADIARSPSYFLLVWFQRGLICSLMKARHWSNGMGLDFMVFSLVELTSVYSQIFSRGFEKWPPEPTLSATPSYCFRVVVQITRDYCVHAQYSWPPSNANDGGNMHCIYARTHVVRWIVCEG